MKIICYSTCSKSGRSSGILCHARSKNKETSTGKLRSRGGLLFLFKMDLSNQFLIKKILCEYPIDIVLKLISDLLSASGSKHIFLGRT